MPEDPVSGKTTFTGTGENLKHLWPFVVRHWRKGVTGAIFILFSSLLVFPQPLITRYIIDDVVLAHRLDRLAGALVLLVGLALAERLFRLLERYYFVRFEQEVLLDLQQDLLQSTLRLPKAFFDDTQTGYLMSRLSADIGGVRWFFSRTIVHLFGNVIRFAGGVGLLFYLEWRLAATVLIVLPGIFFCIRYFAGKIHTLSHHGMEQAARVSGRLQESLSAVTLVKAFSSESRTVKQVMDELKSAFRISLEQVAVSSLADLITSVLPGIARLLVLAVGAYWVILTHWTLGSLLAFQAYLGYVFGPALFLASANLQMQNAIAALERISALFDLVPEENIGKGEVVDRLEGEVRFQNVSFAYDGREPVLEDVSFCIRPGERVAIVGPSGIGKTTLVSLILRFYKPTAGEILFDGRPASDFEVQSLRRRIGYVSQKTRLLSGTVMENLRYGNADAPSEDVVGAASAADIHGFILGLPAGYDTKIGENGIDLSEGQKQRLAIARALVKRPDILVLDEPAAALDMVSERAIFRSLPGLLQHKTLFVVAHRLSTIRHADRILLFDEHRVTAMGDHRTLIESNDSYRSLIDDPVPETERN